MEISVIIDFPLFLKVVYRRVGLLNYGLQTTIHNSVEFRVLDKEIWVNNPDNLLRQSNPCLLAY